MLEFFFGGRRGKLEEIFHSFFQKYRINKIIIIKKTLDSLSLNHNHSTHNMKISRTLSLSHAFLLHFNVLFSRKNYLLDSVSIGLLLAAEVLSFSELSSSSSSSSPPPPLLSLSFINCLAILTAKNSL